jgi:uncharacterized protein
VAAVSPSGPATSRYHRRIIDHDLDRLFGELPAILLDGAKSVGKTTTAEQRCRSVRRLDEAAQLAVIAADPWILGADPRPILVDEWHRHPPVWDAVRRLVDRDSSGGQFLLTGSAPTAATHSGAGRIVSLRMRPLCLEERDRAEPTVSFDALTQGQAGAIAGRCGLVLGDYVDEIVTGGWPGMRHLSAPALVAQLDSYVERIVDHDLPEAGHRVRRPATVRAWLRAYAAATATTASWEAIRDAATPGQGSKPARSTTVGYTELLTALRILDPIEAWTPSDNVFARLGAAPKHHLVDPALAARLLDRTRQHLLAGDERGVPVPRDGTLLGNLFESLVALSVRTYAQTIAAPVFHLRSEQGRREVDFIVEHQGGVLAIEVKLSSTVDDHDVRHLLALRTELGDRWIDGMVVSTGPEAYRRTDSIAVVPLGLLGR